MMAGSLPWRRPTVFGGAVYSNFGETRHRVLLVGGGFIDVYADGFDDTGVYLRFKEGFIRQPEPQTPRYEFLDSVALDLAAVRGIRAIGEELDPLCDSPPFRSVAANIRCWAVGLKRGSHLWVMAHRWRRRWGRIVFEVDTVGGREPNLLPVVSVTTRSISSPPSATALPDRGYQATL